MQLRRIKNLGMHVRFGSVHTGEGNRVKRQARLGFRMWRWIDWPSIASQKFRGPFPRLRSYDL